MKKVLMILSIAVIGLTACEKENKSPNGSNGGNTNNENCDCGTIVLHEYTSTTQDGYLQMLSKYKVKNHCSGNTKWFTSEKGIDGSDIGEDYCASYSW